MNRKGDWGKGQADTEKVGLELGVARMGSGG